MSDINQDDIDKLLQDALGGGGDETPPAPEEMTGPASQDDIDALFAGAGGVSEPAAPEADADLDGVANQDDIDALFAAVGGDSEPAPAPAPAPAPEPAPAAAAPAENDFQGVASNDDIEALFASAANSPEPAPAADPLPAPADDAFAGVASNDDIDAIFADVNASAPAPAADENVDTTDDLDSLLSSIADETEKTTPAAAESTAEFDIHELLRQVSDAAPPPPKTPPPARTDESDTAELPAPAPEPKPAPPPPAAPMPPPVPFPPPANDAAPRQEFTILHGAGEVESVANQITALIATLSEKAHRYMQAWMTADGEARELRSRALAEERRRASMASERDVLSRELDELRVKLGEAEGGRIAIEESKRTLETSFQAKIRELESQVKLFGAEAEGLKDELTRSRNQATGVDIESRRARFEVDRLRNEVESERMERLRIQRALENREKEIQAVQAQASGQASSLFIDELHRLVRRLETELETRASGAHEALKQLDRLETSDETVPVMANVRAALMQAIGAEPESEDALKALGREASGVKGPAAIAPEKTEILSFETALSTYNLSGAMDIAGALLREAKARPATLMRKIYQCPALRRPEIADRLEDLARLLEGLRTIQEATDRSRGSESGESEVFYVHMFDFLHNLVRLKLVSRLSGDIWRLFLDLRGRFSFVTSDKQWSEYRDKTLGDAKANA